MSETECPVCNGEGSLELDAPPVTPVDPETRPFEPVVAGRAE